jgi:hypothetical protein
LAEAGSCAVVLVILLLDSQTPRRSTMTANQELSIAHHFPDLIDPRIDRSRLHELLDIVTIAICAVIAGADSWDDIEDFGKVKYDGLKAFLDLPHGIPSHDTFRLPFSRHEVP